MMNNYDVSIKLEGCNEEILLQKTSNAPSNERLKAYAEKVKKNKEEGEL